jgi:aldehyde:ferredoxin oxidoreductase
MDLCKFSAFAEGAEEYAQQWGIALGRTVTADEVMEAGERVYNLERHYNNLAGFGAGSDTLPSRFLEEPSDSGGSKGHVCELDAMLEEYYTERGWDAGVVSEAKKAALQIP